MFEVANDATRTIVKDAVEQIFDVNVLRVNIINVPAKQTRRGHKPTISRSQSELQKSNCHTGTRRSYSDI